MPRGLISGRNYSECDIFNQALYPRMREEPLLDNDDCIVVPVRNNEHPHFRRIGNASFDKILGKAENNPTHDDCVTYLHNQLMSHGSKKIKFCTYVFENGKKEEQVVFSPLNDSNYTWYKEADARIAFHDKFYIQPDIGGRDVNKFFPRSSYPNVIIEVVRTHSPDKDTFQKLLEISKTNYHVYFYFIGEGKRASVLNNTSVSENEIKIRLSHYLIGGEIYKNGKPYAAQKDNESFEKWYDYLKNSYFTNAMEKVQKV